MYTFCVFFSCSFLYVTFDMLLLTFLRYLKIAEILQLRVSPTKVDYGHLITIIYAGPGDLPPAREYSKWVINQVYYVHYQTVHSLLCFITVTTMDKLINRMQTSFIIVLAPITFGLWVLHGKIR